MLILQVFNFETCFKFCWQINILLARRKSIWRQTVRWNIPRLHFFPIHYSTGIQPQSFYIKKIWKEESVSSNHVQYSRKLCLEFMKTMKIFFSKLVSPAVHLLSSTNFFTFFPFWVNLFLLFCFSFEFQRYYACSVKRRVAL